MMFGPYKEQATHYSVSISKRWINFVHKRCEPGRGLKPKWANNGVDFLLNVCEPQNVAGLSDVDFKVCNANTEHYMKNLKENYNCVTILDRILRF